MANKKRKQTNQANPTEVLNYFRNIQEARKGAVTKSYSNYLQNAEMGRTTGDQNCGVDAMGKPKCPRFLKSGSRFRRAMSKVPWKRIGAGIAGATAGALTYRHAKKNPGSMGGFGDFLRGIGKN